MRGRLLGSAPASTSSPAARRCPRCARARRVLVDRRPHDGVEELERVVADQEVGATSSLRRACRRRRLEPASALAWRSSVPSPRIAAASAARSRPREPREPERDRAADDEQAELEQHVRLVGARRDASRGDRVEEREHEQRFPRVAASTAAQNSASASSSNRRRASDAIEATVSGSGRIAVAAGSVRSSVRARGRAPARRRIATATRSGSPSRRRASSRSQRTDGLSGPGASSIASTVGCS